MGNCGLSPSKSLDLNEERQAEFLDRDQEENDLLEEERYNRDQNAVKTSDTIPSSSAATSSPGFPGTPDLVEIEPEGSELEKSILGSRLMSAAAGLISPWKDEESRAIDPRLVSVLEFFRQLYVRKKPLFGRLISIHRDDFEELLKNMEKTKEMEIEKAKAPSLKRRKSFEAVSRGVELDRSELKLQKFKVKTLGAGDGPDDAKGGGAGGGTGGKGSGTK